MKRNKIVKILISLGLVLFTLFGVSTTAKADTKSYSLNNSCIEYNVENNLKGTKKEKVEKPTIIIDYAHRAVKNGRIDHGAEGELKGRVYYEDDIANDISFKVGKRLEAEGFNVLYTRNISGFCSLSDRKEFCRNNKHDLYLSIHLNSCENSNTAHGTEAFSNDRKELANKIVNRLVKDHGFTKRYVNEDKFYCKDVGGDLLLEVSYINHEKDLLYTLNNKDSIAESIADEIIKNYRN